MDFLVMLEDAPAPSSVLAHVNSVPSHFSPERSMREVVTLYGKADANALALALAVAVESKRDLGIQAGAVRHVGLWSGRGAVGDASWRDAATGELRSQDVDIPFEILRETAGQLLGECGQAIRRLMAGLAMPDWPEGARRAISFTLVPALAGAALTVGGGADGLLDTVREADALGYDSD